MTTRLTLLLFVLPLTLLSGQVPDASFVVRVLDDDGMPVVGADVSLFFVYGMRVSEETNEDGYISASGEIGDGTLFATVTKEGYYTSSGRLWSGGWRSEAIARETPGGFYEIRNRSNLVLLKPPSVFEVRLRGIVNPQPLVIGRAELDFPVVDVPVGFDFDEGDWVEPYGDGQRVDVFFTATRSIVGSNHYTGHLAMSFPGESDGLILLEYRGEEDDFASEMNGPMEAPESGYNSRLEVTVTRLPDSPVEVSYSRSDLHLLRVRSRRNEDGDLVEAAFARIEGGLRFSVAYRREAPSLVFDYYFNPDVNPANRSLEHQRE